MNLTYISNVYSIAVIFEIQRYEVDERHQRHQRPKEITKIDMSPVALIISSKADRIELDKKMLSQESGPVKIRKLSDLNFTRKLQ
jgi:hypothetical protein